MSNLYNISLDHLLKEEKPMSNYLNYLDESTNTVKSKNKLSMLILLVTYLGIWAISLIVFWFFINSSDAMGYSIMFLWVLLPVTTFVIALLIGKNNYMGRWKWCFSIAFIRIRGTRSRSWRSIERTDAFRGCPVPFKYPGIGKILPSSDALVHNLVDFPNFPLFRLVKVLV